MRARVGFSIGVLALSGCGGSPGAATTAPEPSANDGRVSSVTSSVVVDSCPDASKMSSKQAAKEIEELLAPCSSVPGGEAHFSATLMPGGRVELASPSGDPGSGVIPTCLVQNQNQLKHKVKLTAPCKFDVKLEERKAGTAP